MTRQDMLAKGMTLIVAAMRADNDNEALAAIRRARAKLASAGIDIHALKLTDARAPIASTTTYMSFNDTRRLAEAQAEIDRLKTELARQGRTRARAVNTTEWVRRTRYSPAQALEARHRLDQAVLAGTLSRASAAKHKAHIARRTV